MPKKFKGENSKSAEARAKKAAVRHEQEEKRRQQEEDEAWRDDDKHVLRKQQRKEEKEKRRLEQLDRKKELQDLHNEEMSSLKGKTHAIPSKVTRAQIANQQELEAAGRENAQRRGELPQNELPIIENVNRLQPDGLEARSVDEAISALSVNDPVAEKHPEKRMKAAYQKFEEDNLPRLKQENPSMRLSQLKQMLKKDWMKSPENPLNQMTRAYNTKK